MGGGDAGAVEVEGLMTRAWAELEGSEHVYRWGARMGWRALEDGRGAHWLGDQKSSDLYCKEEDVQKF